MGLVVIGQEFFFACSTIQPLAARMNSISIKSPDQVKTAVSIVSLQFKCTMQRKSIRRFDEISYKMVIFRPLEKCFISKICSY